MQPPNFENRESLGASQMLSSSAKKQTLTRAAISLHSMRMGTHNRTSTESNYSSHKIGDRCNRLKMKIDEI